MGAHPDLPTDWFVARVHDLADCIDYLRVPINKETRLSRLGDVPYYGANGQVGWIDDHLFNDDLVLVVEDETFIGREKPFSYIIHGKAWVNNHAHVLKALGDVPTEFLNIILSFYDFAPITSGSTGRRKLTQEALMNAPVWIPPQSEQLEIVRRVERALVSIETIATEWARAVALIARLEQATLATAFSGELVPQEMTGT
jgi:type I restriction enzyme S subunit